jgi:hypothetical protein
MSKQVVSKLCQIHFDTTLMLKLHTLGFLTWAHDGGQ